MIYRTPRATTACCVLLALALDSAHAQELAPPVPMPASRTLAEARERGLLRSALRHQKTRRVAASPEPDLEGFSRKIKPVLTSHCVQCHGPDTQEGNLRVDTLDPNLLAGSDTDWWLEVQAVLSNGEMPPPDEVELSDEDRATVVDWLSSEIQVASVVRRALGQYSSFRRMTRYEFNYALQDLLGLPYDFAKDLPPEANSEDGFRNSSELLHMTVSQLETYRRLARKALRRATVRGERPPVLYWGVTMEQAGRIDLAKQQKEFEKARAAIKREQDEQAMEKIHQRFSRTHSVPYFKNLTTGHTARASWSYGGARYANAPSESTGPIPETTEHVAILPRGRGHRFTIELGNRVPDEGMMRVRVRASRVSADDRTVPSLGLLFGWQASNEGRAVLSVGDDLEIKANPEAPQFYQWDVPLGEIYPRNSVRTTSKMGAMPNPSEYIRLVNNSMSQGPIQLDYVEVAAPVYSQWPPSSHKQIFFDSPSQQNESIYAREVLVSFMQRAWRRVIEPAEIEQKLKLFVAMRGQSETFEEAVVEVLATVLASPNFLYIVRSEPDKELPPSLTATELATRLSMFLWSSVPDAELLRVANTGKLAEPTVLATQVERMLADQRSHRLSQHFVNQWLDMQLLEFRTFDKRRVDARLKQAMLREPVDMFGELLRTDASVLDFIHADYTVANERLAQHYGVRGVKGNHFRRIKLTDAHRRGGLLTQAGLLAMNSAGDDSHPLKRGVWVLESLLNDPPPPPPPAVPEIDLADPRVAKMTLKEQIEDHRNHAACMSCHAKIDPWGIAFENYDAVGLWRDRVKGKPVDATSKLFNKQQLDGMDGLKRFLLEHRQDQFVRSLVHKLTTYALGRPLTFADRAGVDEITARVRQQGDGLATMVKLIATSELFTKK